MLLSLALRYQKHTALFLLSISFVQLTIAERLPYYQDGGFPSYRMSHINSGSSRCFNLPAISLENVKQQTFLPSTGGVGGGLDARRPFIGGPTQPESQSFQSVNSNNMVDLFTGDFSYNIPLMDVGGYPVNIAYNSSVTMDEEASWVGLGWNINPGSITRNMRGVPDDFNGGTDTMRKVSHVKDNVTGGVSLGASIGEVFGLPLNVSKSYGIFNNTYNGWGLETSLNASINGGSKSYGYMSAGLSLTNNSQNGFTVSPGLSYNTKKQSAEDHGTGVGFQVSSPYNSRSGLKSIQLGLNVNAKNKNGSASASDFAGLTFAWPTYSPSITMPMTNYNFSFTAKYGFEINGYHPTFFISGYGGKEYIAAADTSLAIPVYGYMNYQNMGGNWAAITDFNREKEIPYREKPAIPHIAVPAYTYDVFSVSGEGTSGSFRAYRGDIGFIADHIVKSKTITGSASIDLGAGNLVHGGTDLNANYSVSQAGPWLPDNALAKTIAFRNNKELYEAVYFRNPGEKAINTTAFYDAIGGDDVVTPELYQSNNSSSTILATNTLARFNGKKRVGAITLKTDSAIRTTRDKRSQVITYLSAAEAAVAGLDKYIYRYDINKFGSRHCEDNSTEDAVGEKNGLMGYYYRNTSLNGPFITRLDTNIYFNWDKDYPLWNRRGGVNTLIDQTYPRDNLSVRWVGRLKAPATGAYTFGIYWDDAVRFWINDSLVIDRWKRPQGDGWDTCRVNLLKDKLYNIRLEYFELGGKAYVQLAWRTPDMPGAPLSRHNKVAVPSKYLYLPKFHDTTAVDPILTREDRVNNFRKASHMSEVRVLNADGMRYVYGIPVYNLLQKEVSFSVNKGNENTDLGLTKYTDGENSTGNNSGKTGYYSREEIPAYAHTFLLTGILTPDYVDVTGNGISDDDLGDGVKFNYSKACGIANPFEWRAPYITDSANYNEGLKTYDRDDKAHYIYGKKELWYLHSIESKTMIANFTLQRREDLLEIDESGKKKNNGKAYCLKQIDLYSKADFLQHGQNATPIKTVHFEYSYELCPGVNRPVNELGKLTLKRIWFTYNGNEKGKLNPYVFHYHKNNPGYRTNATDKWGTYKDPAQNPGSASGNLHTNADYPYALQDSTLAANNAGAWKLDSIKLPSGARIKVKYESDDYAYVQNRRATQMLELAGFGQNGNGTYSDKLYRTAGDQVYAYVKIPFAVSSRQELYARYLEDLTKIYFKIFVHMPSNDGFGSGAEYVPAYAEPDFGASQWYGTTSDPNIIWIKLAGVNKSGDGGGSYSPLAQTAIHYLRLNLPSKAYPGSELEGGIDFKDLIRIMASSVGNVVNMLYGFSNTTRALGWACKTDPHRSYVRLNCATLKKYGGGLRVKSILIYDHWNAMTKKKETVYGQHYDYTTTSTVNGKVTRISSGVASWEPAIGGDENPFHLPIEYLDQVSVMAPAAMQYTEEPLGEAFYPAASVGYSKVRMRTVHAAKTRSANGYTESTFYTSYDFPTSWDWSMIDGNTKKRFKPLLGNLLRVNARSFLALSQGFKVELNDMNGKMRTQASYSETDPVHPISYTENFYRVDNQSATFKHLNNEVAAIDPYGNIDPAATIGKDVELMADMRDHTSTSIGGNLNLNVDLFAAGVWPLAIPTALSMYQQEKNQFRSAAITKIIHRYGILDSVVHFEKGSLISSKNVLYDAETGNPLLVRTQNEFNDPVYQFTYPAHWVYKGTGPAYRNIGVLLKNVTVKNGKIVSALPQPDSAYLTAGDELLVYSKQTISSPNCNTSTYATFPDAYRLWVIDTNVLNGGPQQLYLIDQHGVPFSGNDITLKVVRSGHRNLNGAAGSITSLRNPMVADAQKQYHLVFDTATRVVSAAAAEMQQYWKVADRRKSDVLKDCINTPLDSARFKAEACSCLKPFFQYLIASNNLFIKKWRFKSVRSLVNEANAAGYTINLSNCPVLQANANERFYALTDNATFNIYKAKIGDVTINLNSRTGLPVSFYSLTGSACTPEGVVYKDPSAVAPSPATVTIRIVPDFSASLISNNGQCPSFRDSLTTVDSTSDRLIIENNLNVGGYDRNAISILRFKGVQQIPLGATITSAKLVLQADQRGHHLPMWPHANSVHPVDSVSVAMLTPGWFPFVPLDTLRNAGLASDWHQEVSKATPFQNDTIDVTDYLNGYREGTYASNTFILTQGSQDLHGADAIDDEKWANYLQGGYGNYYSTYYSQRYPDAAKWPAMNITYVMPAGYADTMGAILQYDGTIHCTDIVSRFCYSAVTDTTVNPYQYGILGNFRPLRSYVYYAQRSESDPAGPIDLRSNGAIKEFAPFWTLQGNRWMPSYDTTRWVWNSQSTLFNPKGFELENKDPLGRYNAGVYGYGSTLPTAVLQNSHFQEGAYEGFEDYSYEGNTCDTGCSVSRSFDFSAYKASFSTKQAHTGLYSIKVNQGSTISITANIQPAADAANAWLTAAALPDACAGSKLKGMLASPGIILPSFAPLAGQRMIIGAWVKEDGDCLCKSYTRNHIIVGFEQGGSSTTLALTASGNLVEGWQRYDAVVDIPANATQMTLTLQASDMATTYFDDIRIHPYNAQMRSYVYNAVNLRQMAELDENNYATFYEYDDDGTLIRLKKETDRGIQTIKETRSALLKE
ncbi:hypothetical protein FAM09_23655 [Niastella caeni]|uniref:PA14 domain-containing protein n=1 Tax=Niastella caeni TaxID=2569763 RepID=A0A4S8HIX2_9BACT|nr:PA14 domain-containing protein [Niastella caeni]THU34985.1 hypothetical protein FAM09_23655 [Niastella caeni]